MKCDDCDVRWEIEHAGEDCWNCGKPGEQCFAPAFKNPAPWVADRNDPLPASDSAA